MWDQQLGSFMNRFAAEVALTLHNANEFYRVLPRWEFGEKQLAVNQPFALYVKPGVDTDTMVQQLVEAGVDPRIAETRVSTPNSLRSVP